MRPAILRFLVLFPLLTGMTATYGQHSDRLTAQDSLIDRFGCHQMDIFDVLSRKKIQAPEIPTRKVRAIVLPLIAYSPGTGFQLGAGSSLSFTIGKKPLTNLSAGSLQVLWTTERQLISYIKGTVYFNDNKWYLQTDWRWYLYNLPTYGLGTGPPGNIPPLPQYPDTPEKPVKYDGGRFPMKYNWIKAHMMLMRQVKGSFYAGMGYHYDRYYDIVDEVLNLDTTVRIITPHYAYCVQHGFDNLQYTSSGISLDVAYDSRDNIINAYKGIYLFAGYRYDLTALGSSLDGSSLYTEFRTYVGLSRKTPRHLLAFRAFGSFHMTGEVPYLNLMASGYDPNNTSGRGYTDGRWRGEDFVYGEMEYRFPISPCSGIVGGVLFANLTTASNRDMGVPLFAYLRPGFGFGFRVMVGKNDRTNLLIDFGLGYLSTGMYLQAQEVF